MKPNSGVPRRTMLAIAAASAGLTLAVTATIAGGLGLIEPAAASPRPSAGNEQPAQPWPGPMATESLVSAPTGGVERSAATVWVAPSTGSTDVRLARREHEDDDADHDGRAEKARRTSLTEASAERSTRRPVSRDRGDDDDV